MNFRLIAAAIASIFLGFATQSFAQSNADRATGSGTQTDDAKAFTHGESKRCESLSGAAKDQCDKDAGTCGARPSSACRDGERAQLDRFNRGRQNLYTRRIEAL
jgi:hypothetical protein